jgi:hypothetical protein
MKTFFIVLSCALAIALGGCTSLAQPPASIPAAAALPARATASNGTLLYVANYDNNVVDFYQYKDGVAGNLVGSIKETRPTGICTDSAGDVYVALFDEHRVDKFLHGATTPESSIAFTSAYPYACAVDNSNGDLAVSTQTGHNKFNWGWFIDVYTAGGSQRQGYDAYNHFTGVHALAYDNNHDLFAVGYPCGSSGYCESEDSSGDAPGLYELTSSGFYFYQITLKGATLVDPTGLAWINPALLVDDSDYQHETKGVGIKLLVNGGVGTVTGTIPFVGTRSAQGIAVRAGDVVVADERDTAVRTYSIANGSLLSTLHQKAVHPQAVAISQ